MGCLHSIEFDRNIAGKIIPQELKERFDQHLGDSRRALPLLLRRLGQIDFFFHDGDHTHKNMKFEFETVWPYLNGHGGILASDDITSNSAFTDFAEGKGVIPHLTGSFAYIVKGRRV